MKNEFDKEQDLLQPPDIFHNQDPRDVSPGSLKFTGTYKPSAPKLLLFISLG